MNDTHEVPADDFTQRLAEGRATISKLWPRLHSGTQTWLMTPDDNGQAHFNSSGRYIDTEDQFGAVARVEHALGTIRLAVKATLPFKGTDVIPALLNGDEVLNQAAEMMHWPAGREPEFAAMALHALLKQRTCLALQMVYLTGGTIDEPKFHIIRLVGRIVVGLLFILTMPLTLGYGLTFAFKGDAVSASLCAYWGLFGLGYLIDAKKAAINKELTAYRRWLDLCSTNFHIGTGHGLEVKLTEMLRANIEIPSVLFDLCAITRGRTDSASTSVGQGNVDRAFQ